MNLNHLHINVPDIRKAQDFYERYFDFKLKFSHGDGVFLSSPEGFLLAIDPLEEGEKPHEFPKWFHFGFCLAAPEGVRELYSRMKSDGVEFSRELREFGGDAVNFYCWAPGNYRLEVTWNREE